MHVLTARWLFPGDAPPIEDGAVAVQEGRLVAVGPRREVLAAHGSADRQALGDAAILPGLVNCHTHLDLPALSAPPDGEGFVPWVLALLAARRAAPPEAEIATANALALLAAGTTTVADVSAEGESLVALRMLGLRGTLFREVLGLSEEAASPRLAAARLDLAVWRAVTAGSRLAIGLAPHSPYALSEPLFAGCRALCLAQGLPATIHAAESAAETEFVARGTGPIRDRLYPAVDCPEPPPRRRARSPLRYLEAVGLLEGRPLLAHAVHVDVADLEVMVRCGVAVAHCPRSNTRLSGGVAPVPAFLERGIPVGLGTDSLASVDSLDLWDEMRAALAVHGGRLTPAAVLGLATRGGAAALGLADAVGSLAVGKRADLIAVRADAVRAADPTGSLLAETTGADVLLSLIDGEVRYDRAGASACA